MPFGWLLLSGLLVLGCSSERAGVRMDAGRAAPDAARPDSAPPDSSRGEDESRPDGSRGRGQERCNGADDDGDGHTDEGCPCSDEGNTRPCFVGDEVHRGVGACVPGQQRCQASGEFGLVWSECEGSGAPAAETCGNQIDDDCDGNTDEDCTCQVGESESCYPGPEGTAGMGVCSAGTRSCEGGEWTRCTGMTTPSDEQCGDGADNDCDGAVDCRDPDCDGHADCRSGCRPAGETFDLAPASAELLMLADRSDSMLQIVDGQTSAWEALVGAFDAVLPRIDDGFHMGLLAFPSLSGESCGVAGTPNVPVQQPSASQINGQLASMDPGSGGTPMYGALDSARQHLSSMPAGDRPRFLVLATDGLPGCSTTAEVVGLLETIRSDLGVETFVLGIAEGGYFHEDQDFRDNLNRLAVAGGRPRSADAKYYPMELPREFESALVGVTASASECEYELDVPPADPSALDVRFDDNPVSRGSSNGWTLEGAATLRLHGSACAQLQSGHVQSLEVSGGCE
jgi:hypothetical protein